MHSARGRWKRRGGRCGLSALRAFLHVCFCFAWVGGGAGRCDVLLDYGISVRYGVHVALA